MTDAIILRPDAKGRITLGEITNNVSSYRVTVEDKELSRNNLKGLWVRLYRIIPLWMKSISY